MANIHEIRKMNEGTSGNYRPNTNFAALGFSEKSGSINIKSNHARCVRMGARGSPSGCQWLCKDCKLSPEAHAWLMKNREKTQFTTNSFEMKDEDLKRLNIINEKGDYVPYDPKKAELEKLESEPLKILNETQKIKAEPEIIKPAQINIYELPETKDYTKYFIVGGISIAILVIALIWSLR